jgi:hypothetical protein
MVALGYAARCRQIQPANAISCHFDPRQRLVHWLLCTYSKPGDRQAHRLPVLRVHLILALGRREGAGTGHAHGLHPCRWADLAPNPVVHGLFGRARSSAAFGHSFPSLVLLLRLDRLQGCSPKARLDAKASRTVGQHRVQVCVAAVQSVISL